MKRLVIGWGNPLREDDAAGYRAAELTGGLAVHQLTPDLAQDVAEAEDVIFIDADSSIPAGEWMVTAVAAAGAADLTHRCTPDALLGLAQTLYSRAPRARLIRIGISRAGHGENLSPPVAAAVEAVVRYVTAVANA
jgi:hydrogenase maturation protease